MSGTPQARTPAKKPAGSHPVRHRLHVTSAATAGASPASRPVHGPKTPPSTTKTKKKPQPAVKGSKLTTQTPAFAARAPAHSAAAEASSPHVTPRSGRRHTDTAGPLDFLDLLDDAAGVSPVTTPRRPSRLPDAIAEKEDMEEKNHLVDGVLRATEVGSRRFSDKKTTLSTAVAGVRSQSSAEDAPTHSPPHISNSSSASSALLIDEEEEKEEVVKGQQWSSVKKLERASSLSSASLLSPARPLPHSEDDDGADDTCGPHDDRDNAPTRAAKDSAVATETTSVAAPLPVTPERPVQVRYFRCAKPLLQVGADATITPASAAAVETSLLVHVCGALQHESSVACATPHSCEPAASVLRRSEGVKDDDSDEAGLLHTPCVLDMNTTLVDDEEEESDTLSGEDANHSLGEENALHAAAVLQLRAVVGAGNSEKATTGASDTADSPLSATLAPPTSQPLQAIEDAVAEAEVLSVPVPSATPATATLPPFPDVDPRRAVYDGLRLEQAADANDETSSTCSAEDSRAVSESSEEGVLHRVATAAPAGLPASSSARPRTTRSSSGHATVDSSFASSHRSAAKATADARRLSPSPARGEDHEQAPKRVSLSSARGQSSSYGCTEGMTSPESHQTRRSTPQMEDDEGDDDNETAEQTNTSSIAVGRTERAEAGTRVGCRTPSPAPTTRSLDNASASPSDVVVMDVESMRTAKAGAAVVPIRDVQFRPCATGVMTTEPTEEEVRDASHVAVYHEKLTPSRRGACERLWRTALVSLDALVAEYQQSLLTCVMNAAADAWYPSAPPTGLHHVNKAALVRSKVSWAAQKALPPPPASVNALTATLQEGGYTPNESELSFLFRLYAAAPSDDVRAGLCATFFSLQMQRYINWVHHFEFEFLYVRMVAVRAMHMLELHERRMICMRRDLGIRDRIELFMLLAPRPRAPTLSAGRGVFSAFRMALHALGGGDSHSQPQQRSRSKSKIKVTQGGNGRTQKTASRPPPPALPPTPLTAISSSARQPPAKKASTVDTNSDREGDATEIPRSTLEPLFTSERCGSGKYAVPIVCELASRAPETRSCPAAAEAHQRTGNAEARDEKREEKEEDAGSDDDDDDRQERSAELCEVREVSKDVDPPREPASDRHRGTPRPLNKTYSNYYKLVAEKKSGAAPVLSNLHLPLLPRTASRTSSASRAPSSDRTAKAASAAAAPSEETECAIPKKKEETGAYEERLYKLGQLLTHKPRRSPKRRKDKVLPSGKIRAKERVAPKPRTRTPPPPPTEADFVDLHDEEALKRFLI